MQVPSSSPQVFISGAGPTGLTGAAILAKHGIPVRIADKNSHRSDQSRALAVQAGTLECLEAAFGPELVAKFIAAGKPTRKATLHLEGLEPRVIDLSSIPSKYNYILVLAQSETERLLEELLESYGVKVERETEVLSVTGRGDRVTVALKGGETFNAAFAIGADGAHSIVRENMNLEFEGGTYDGEFILADVTLEWPWSYDSVRAMIGERGVIGAFPLKGEHHYRLIMVNKSPSERSLTTAISMEEFRKHLDYLSQSKIKVTGSEWMTRFRVHHRMVDRFQAGRLFLAGDAAHIHSPAGGQGMNTGIQDALNLGFKLKAVLAGAPLDLLEEYEAERLPVARNVLRMTDLFSRIMLLPETPLSRILRRTIIPIVAGTGWIQRRMMTGVSQVNIARKEIARYKIY